jgi:hypothetical protein
MAQYTAVVNATSNGTINTEDTFIELFPPSGVSILLKRVRISFPHTTVSDVPNEIRVTRASAAGATGTAFTPVERRPSGPASVTTCNVKNGTAAFSVGTVVDTVIRGTVNSRGVFEWVARDERDIIESGVNQRMAITCKVNLVSMILDVECDWEE